MQASLVCAMTVVLAFCGVAGAAAGQAPAQVERGKEVYSSQKCAMCHAVEGKGNPKGKLDGVGGRVSEADIRKWIVTPSEMPSSGRKPDMRAYKLPPADLDALVAYLSSLKS